jgi:hypothetical protein
LPVLRTIVPLGLSVIAFAALIAPQRAFAQDSALALPEIRIISSTPVPAPRRSPRQRTAAAPAPRQRPPSAAPGAIDADKVPANAQTLSAADFDKATAPDLLSALSRSLPGVALGNQTGNEFQRDLNYRGFAASPVIGTPQELAVYQNGVRINEVFGDIVNWDFVPESAIGQMTLVCAGSRSAPTPQSSRHKPAAWRSVHLIA